MTIDSRYEQLASLRSSAKVLYPIFMAVSLGKVAWIALPQLAHGQAADTLGTAIFCLGCGGGVVAWLMAGLGSRYEHFGAVMLFNVLTACAIVFVRPAPHRWFMYLASVGSSDLCGSRQIASAASEGRPFESPTLVARLQSRTGRLLQPRAVARRY